VRGLACRIKSRIVSRFSKDKRHNHSFGGPTANRTDDKEPPRSHVHNSSTPRSAEQRIASIIRPTTAPYQQQKHQKIKQAIMPKPYTQAAITEKKQHDWVGRGCGVEAGQSRVSPAKIGSSEQRNHHNRLHSNKARLQNTNQREPHNPETKKFIRSR